MKNSSDKCEMSATILMDRLYGEGERGRYDLHISECQACRSEFEGLSNVRSSVVDWRRAEFDILDEPRIVIPYEPSTPDSSWFDAVRVFLSSFPIRIAAVTAAVVLVAVTVVVLRNGSSAPNATDELLANVETPKVVNAPLPTAPIVENTSTEVASDERPAAKEQDRAPRPAQDVKRTNSARIPHNAPTPAFRKELIADKDVPDAEQPTNSDRGADRVKRTPSLGGDEPVRDDSLRLADLFDDSDTIY